jgi:hypothetical protein
MAKHYKVPSAVVSGAVGCGSRKAANTGGALTRVRVHDVFAAPAAAAVDTIVASVAASNEAAGADLTIAAQPDIPRNLSITADAAQTEKITVTGTDQFGNAQTEEITFNGASTVAGTKVFKTVTTVHQAQRSGAANISVGVGSLLGTSRRVVGLGLTGGVYTTANGETTMVQETTCPVRAVTANVHGVTFATALAATKTYELGYITDEAK